MIRRNSHAIDELELMAYLDGELSRERAAATASHLEQCAECKALAGDLRGVSQEVAGWQVGPSNAEITAALSTGLEEHVRSRESSSRRDQRVSWHGWRVRPMLVGGLAAAVLALFLISLSIPKLMRSPEKALMSTSRPSPAVRALQGPIASPSSNPTITVSDLALDSLSQIAPETASKLEKENPHAGLRGANGELLAPSGPMVVRTAELAMTTTEFDPSRNRVEEILKSHKGYLGDLNISETPSSARILTATLRVPSDQLDSTIAELKTLGRVESESQKGEEVSQQYVDLQARLLNARNSEQRLTELLRRAGKLSDVLAVEEQIESVRENIERMEAERKNLAKQVAFSTLNMKVTEDYKERVHVVPDSALTRLRNAAVEGYEMMVAGLISLLLFLVAWGPSLLLWGAVLFFPLRWWWRKRQRDLI